MNSKVVTILIVIVLIALCVLAAIYSPNLGEMIQRIHTIPQH